MENVKFRALSTCILIFVVVVNLLFSESISWTKYSIDSDFSGYRCIPSLTVFETNAVDASACGILCHSENMCLSFVYQADDQKCIGCMIDLLDQLYLDQADGLPGSTYYRNRVDCKDILGDNRAASSGIYEIKTWKSKSKIKVLCDMETSGGGWTVFHNRFDGSVDFYRNFTDYENGFGDIAGEFWLGFKYMQEMVKAGQSQLLLQVTAKDRSTGHELAGDFSLRSENLYYEDQILFSLGIATRYRCLLGLSGAAFTTMDRDVEINCAEQMRSPWWYRNCGDEICNLHGKYGENGPAGYYHQGIAGYYEPLKASRMMFRRKHGYF